MNPILNQSPNELFKGIQFEHNGYSPDVLKMLLLTKVVYISEVLNANFVGKQSNEFSQKIINGLVRDLEHNNMFDSVSQYKVKALINNKAISLSIEKEPINIISGNYIKINDETLTKWGEWDNYSRSGNINDL